MEKKNLKEWKFEFFRPEYAKETAMLIEENLLQINTADYPLEKMQKLVKEYSEENLLELGMKQAIYVVLSKGKVIATASYANSWDDPDGKKGELFLLSVFVKAEEHGKGVGRYLMEKLEKIAFELGRKKLRLCASITAAGFYEKIGYQYQCKQKELTVERLYQMEKEIIPSR